MDKLVVSDETAPEMWTSLITCFANIKGRAGVGTVTRGTSASLGGAVGIFGSLEPVVFVPGKGCVVASAEE